MARTTVGYLINEVRRLSGAGTAEYDIGTISYFTDAQIETLLDSRRTRLAREHIDFEKEYDPTSNDLVYKHARVGRRWVEDTDGGTVAFIITDSDGDIISADEWSLSPEDGYLTFSTDQDGSLRYVTGWTHNPYQAAIEVLLSWSAHLCHEPDFSTDNMKVKRSQKAQMLRAQIAEVNKLAGIAPEIKVVRLARDDLKTL